MTGSKLIDTSIWLDYFYKYKYKEIIDVSEIMFISVLSLFEIRKKMYKDKLDSSKIEALMTFLEKKSLLQPVSKEITELAAQLSFQHGIAAVDALIYATALHYNAELITRDNDFRGLPNARVLS